MPTPPKDAISVTAYGARGDDEEDDTDAIQRAFDRVPEGAWLVFPPGRYLHRKALWLRKPGVKLWGAGATLHGTNPDDQALLLAADGTAAYRFTITGTTDKRRDAPWHTGIAVFDRVNRETPLRDVVVRGNRVVPAGAPGSPLANASSSAGIFVYGAERFLIAENTVTRSLADGIHVTGGSHDGRVLRNTVRETGDDMIGLVSYLGRGSWVDRDANEDAQALARFGLSQVVHDVVVAHNDLAGQYWGRGIGIVGGRGLTIRDNTIRATTHGAAIYVAREPSYVTHGVRDVRIEHNAISDVQTTDPAYVPASFKFRRSGHAAIEIYSRVFADEAKIPALVDAFRVQDILVADNTIDGTAEDAIRIAPGRGGPAMVGRRQDGTPVVRAIAPGPVERIAVVDNRITGLSSGAAPLRIAGPSVGAVRCANNRQGTASALRAVTAERDGDRGCDAPMPKVTGAHLCAN